MKKKLGIICAAMLTLATATASAAEIFVEAESFAKKGGWVVDQQYMDIMGSPYLLAHGMGEKVESASTEVKVVSSARYYVYVRTFNWTSPWSEKSGPGAFTLSIDGKQLGKTLGTEGNKWLWQYVGSTTLKAGDHTLALNDLTGFNGRCDAIYLSTEQIAPPHDAKSLDVFRRGKLGLSDTPEIKKKYDFVVVGGGVAGMCAALAAAREGMHVALLNDRPILGGCNSSEVRVHLGGGIGVGPYQNLGNLLKEFGHTRGGNAKPAEYYEDEAKHKIIKAEDNIDFFPNNRMVRVTMDGDKIASVVSQHIETAEEILFSAPLFADCTGDGTLGYLAGADFRMGRESMYETGETGTYNLSVGYGPGIKGGYEKGVHIAPKKADNITMGSSVQWYSKETPETTKFPRFEYGIEFNDDNVEDVDMGEWTWENGMHLDQILDAEYIRDYGLMVIFSNWSYLKNKSKLKSKYAKRELDWVAYVAGRRESRRLLGDYILTGTDVINQNIMSDGTAASTWSIDLHYPNPDNASKFPTGAFKSVAKHVKVYEYPVPYRCLYSRNVNNLFMAGRNISVTHVALGTTRVMRTTAMFGEVIGLAASVCKEHGCEPRRVYQTYFPELKKLMEQGAGKQGLPNNQIFNGGQRRIAPKKK